MKLIDLDESVTPVPIEASADAVSGTEELAVLPVHELERGTACILIAKQGRLWVSCRTDNGGPAVPPTVSIEPVEWTRVGIGPLGLAGRVPGGLLGGPEATNHLLTVAAGDHLYEACMHGERGMEAVEGFVKNFIHRVDDGDYLEKMVDDLLKGKTTPHLATMEITNRLADDLRNLKSNDNTNF